MFGIKFSKRNMARPPKPIIEDEGYGVSGGFSFLNTKKSGALALSAVYCATEMIANSIAALPIESENENVVNIFNHTKQGKYMFVKSLITDMILYGNGFAYIVRNSKGQVEALRYLNATDVTIFYDKNKDYLRYHCSVVGGNVDPADMIHIYKNSKDGYTGIGVLQFASRSIDLANYTEDSAIDYYKDGLNMAGILHAKTPLTKAQAQQALQSVEGNIDTGSGKRIKFIPFDLDFNTLTANAKDAALVESRLYNITEIARYFCISPTLLQDLSHSGYSSIEAANLQFLTQTLVPYIFILETELTRKFGVDVNLDETALLRTDAKSTAEYYINLANNGILTTNECRTALGYEAIEGGDKITKAYTKIDDNIVAEK